MKIGTPFLRSVLIPLVFFTGCAQKRLAPPDAQLLQGEINVADEAYWTIDKDLDALREELKISERVLGKPLDRSVYDNLNRAKQAVKNRDAETSRKLYRQTIELARDHLVDESSINAFRRALVNIERRLGDNGPCKEAWADLTALEVKQILRRIVIPEFKIEPPATLIDALDYFKQAIRDYDVSVPVSRRGVSLVLKLPASPESHSTGNGEDPFASGSIGHNNAPVVPKISARFITVYDAITLVCDVTGYKFDTRGGYVKISPRDDDDGARKGEKDTN